MFSEFGSVQRVSIIRNRHSGESSTYEFAERDGDEDAVDADLERGGVQGALS